MDESGNDDLQRRARESYDEAVKQLRSKGNELTEKVVTVAQHVQTGRARRR